MSAETAREMAKYAMGEAKTPEEMAAVSMALSLVDIVDRLDEVIHQLTITLPDPPSDEGLEPALRPKSPPTMGPLTRAIQQQGEK